MTLFGSSLPVPVTVPPKSYDRRAVPPSWRALFAPAVGVTNTGDKHDDEDVDQSRSGPVHRQ